MNRAFERDAGRGPPLRGDGQPVPRRRHHGAVRRPDRARGSRSRARPTPRSAIRRRLDELRDELQRRRGIIFQVRQGLNTGLVVVGTIGTDLRMDYTAVGDTTNVAARLQQIADPGRIVISAPTHRLVDGYFYTRSLGELPLKGKAEPVPAWEVISGAGGPDAPRGRGRARADALRRTRAGARSSSATPSSEREPVDGQIVFVAGEPGIGKSRLLLEFRRRLAGDATWVEGHCMSFGRSIAFHPLIDLLKRSFRIEEGDGESAIIKKIERVGPRPRRGPPADPPAPQVSALGRSGRSRHRGHGPPTAPR